MRASGAALVVCAWALLSGCPQGAGYLDTYERGPSVDGGGDGDGGGGGDAGPARWQRLTSATGGARMLGAAARGATVYVALDDEAMQHTLRTQRFDDGAATALTTPSPFTDVTGASLAIASDGVAFMVATRNGTLETFAANGDTWRALAGATLVVSGGPPRLAPHGTTVDLVVEDDNNILHLHRLDRGAETWTDLGVIVSASTEVFGFTSDVDPVVLYRTGGAGTVAAYVGGAWTPRKTFSSGFDEPALAEDAGALYLLSGYPTALVERYTGAWTDFHPSSSRFFALLARGGAAYTFGYANTTFLGVLRLDGATATPLTLDTDDGGRMTAGLPGVFARRFLAIEGGYLYAFYDHDGAVDFYRLPQ